MRRFFTTMTVAAAVATLLGCTTASVPEDSLLEKNWSRSYESAIVLQTANPEAGKNLEPIEGMDGATAVDNYRNRLKKDGATAADKNGTKTGMVK